MSKNRYAKSFIAGKTKTKSPGHKDFGYFGQAHNVKKGKRYGK